MPWTGGPWDPQAERHLHKAGGGVLREAPAEVARGAQGRQGSTMVGAVLVEDLGFTLEYGGMKGKSRWEVWRGWRMVNSKQMQLVKR